MIKVDSLLINFYVFFKDEKDSTYFKRYKNIFLPHFLIEEKYKKKFFVTVKRGSQEGIYFSPDHYKLKLIESSVTDKKRIGLDTLILISHLTDLENYKKQIYSFHSIAIKKKKKGIIVLGESGAGKTSLSLYLRKIDRDIEVPFSDKVIVKNIEDSFFVVGGIQKEIIRHYYGNHTCYCYPDYSY